MKITIKTSLAMLLKAESSNDPSYRVLPAPRSGAEGQSGGADKTEPASLADIWGKYHRAREIYEKACTSAEGTISPDGAGHR